MVLSTAPSMKNLSRILISESLQINPKQCSDSFSGSFPALHSWSPPEFYVTRVLQLFLNPSPALVLSCQCPLWKTNEGHTSFCYSWVQNTVVLAKVSSFAETASIVGAMRHLLLPWDIKALWTPCGGATWPHLLPYTPKQWCCVSRLNGGELPLFMADKHPWDWGTNKYIGHSFLPLLLTNVYAKLFSLFCS